MLTKQQKQFIKGMLHGLNAGDAALKAGYNSKAYGYYLKTQADIKSELTRQMEIAGIDEARLAKKLQEGLDAETVPRRDGGRQYPDHFIRKQFLEMVFKIRGDFAPEKTETIQKTVQITLDGDLVRALKDSNVLGIEETEYLDAVIVQEAIGSGAIGNTTDIKELKDGESK